MTEATGETVAPLVAPQRPESTTLPFEFRGTAGEYFRIWIVNLVLTILTLGIYSAWAKVRTYRYLHGSTWLDGRSFEYTARPITILKGRLIAVAVFAGWYALVNFLPLLAIVLLPVVMATVPWIVVRSLRFRTFHTRYRNVRFGFHGSYGEAAVVYLWWPIAALFTLGLLWPLFAYARANFTYGKLSYGATRFSFSGRAGVFYKIYIVLFGLLFLAGSALVFLLPVLTLLAGVEPDPAGTEATAGQMLVLALPIYFVGLLLYTFPPAYLKASVGNYTLNELTAAQQAFASTMSVREVYWIYLTNLLAIVFTLGLAIPWATIRMARYRAAHTRLLAGSDLAAMPAGDAQRVSAAGEEIGDIFDFDIGF